MFFELEWKVDQRIPKSVRAAWYWKLSVFNQPAHTHVMYTEPTENSIEKSATGIEFLRISLNTNNDDVCSVNNNSCNTGLGFCLRENLIGF